MPILPVRVDPPKSRCFSREDATPDEHPDRISVGAVTPAQLDQVPHGANLPRSQIVIGYWDEQTALPNEVERTPKASAILTPSHR